MKITRSLNPAKKPENTKKIPHRGSNNYSKLQDNTIPTSIPCSANFGALKKMENRVLRNLGGKRETLVVRARPRTPSSEAHLGLFGGGKKVSEQEFQQPHHNHFGLSTGRYEFMVFVWIQGLFDGVDLGKYCDNILKCWLCHVDHGVREWHIRAGLMNAMVRSSVPIRTPPVGPIDDVVLCQEIVFC